MVTGRTKAVSYSRVSSHEQEQEGFSIPAQKDLLRDFAEKNNISRQRLFFKQKHL
jgi:site-specific DNA recombinase